VLVGAVVGEHERPVGAWQAEWQPLTELLALAGGAVAHAVETVSGLEVDAVAMAANVDRLGGVLLAERVSLALAAALGRADAKAAVAAAAARAVAAAGRGRPDFAAALAADEGIAAVVDRRAIDALLEPSGYLGATGTWIDRALAAYRERS
jgi:3-carboxy-cis,cis-muconate cycloisomerase